MWILSKSKQCLVNSDTIDRIYQVSSCLRACFARTNGDATLGKYESEYAAIQALKLLTEAMRAGVPAYQMPDDERIRAAMIADSPAGKERAADGKKTVRRGGS